MSSGCTIFVSESNARLMKTIHLLFTFVLTALLFCPNTSAGTIPPQGDKGFASFIEHFTQSAAFQYSRIKFPLKTPITLMADDGKSEKTFSFTRDKWPLISAELLKEKNETSAEGATYIAKYITDSPTHKVFQAGYEDSEIDLKIVFDLVNDRWYVTDCCTAWYNFELSMAEFREAVRHVQQENAAFIKVHP